MSLHSSLAIHIKNLIVSHKKSCGCLSQFCGQYCAVFSCHCKDGNWGLYESKKPFKKTNIFKKLQKDTNVPNEEKKKKLKKKCTK